MYAVGGAKWSGVDDVRTAGRCWSVRVRLSNTIDRLNVIEEEQLYCVLTVLYSLYIKISQTSWDIVSMASLDANADDGITIFPALPISDEWLWDSIQTTLGTLDGHGLFFLHCVLINKILQFSRDECCRVGIGKTLLERHVSKLLWKLAPALTRRRRPPARVCVLIWSREYQSRRLSLKLTEGQQLPRLESFHRTTFLETSHLDNPGLMPFLGSHEITWLSWSECWCGWVFLQKR